jgi:hypothetical protein
MNFTRRREGAKSNSADVFDWSQLLTKMLSFENRGISVREHQKRRTIAFAGQDEANPAVPQKMRPEPFLVRA